MQDIADDFVENVAAFACELAVHRGGTTLEAKDIQLALGTHASSSFTWWGLSTRRGHEISRVRSMRHRPSTLAQPNSLSR